MRSWQVLLAAFAALAAVASADEKKVVCYFGSWSVYRPGAGKFDISYIDPTLCTHMIYTFVGISEEGDVKVLDAWQDLPDNYGKDAFGRFNKLREKSPGTKTMVAIGGWNEGSSKYSKVAADPTLRARFVRNVVAFVEKYGFDGFDVDWEYPAQRGGSADDKRNYVLLLKELREAFDPKGFLLSAAVGAAETSASLSYDIAQVSKYLHFINLMAYDFHGQWEPVTGHNAPLYPAKRESGDVRKFNVDAAVQYWLSQGAAPEKLVLGMGLYGRSFTLEKAENHGVGAAKSGPGAAGPFTREPGMLGYNEICKNIENGWTVERDEEQRVPYAYYDRQWVGFDDVQSIAEKAEYVKKHNLGGGMVWSIETDDFHGNCGPAYPLLKTINHVLRNGKPVPPSPPRPSTPKPNVPTTNRPVGPTNPPSGDGAYCTQVGFVRDPQDCGKFYFCSMVDDRFVANVMHCPTGLHFDLNTNVCDYPEKVQC